MLVTAPWPPSQTPTERSREDSTRADSLAGNKVGGVRAGCGIRPGNIFLRQVDHLPTCSHVIRPSILVS